MISGGGPLISVRIFASPRHFDFLDCETEISKCFETPRHLRIKNKTARRT